MGHRGRDVEVIDLDNDQCLVIACDSCGAIGEKEMDLVQVPNYIVGRFTSRVALLEILTVGAKPISLSITISNEEQPTGDQILEGVREELEALGLSTIPIAISTEKNILTRQTGLGVTVIGVLAKSNLRIARSKPGDQVYSLGIPKVGEEVKSTDDPEIISGNVIQELLELSEIHDLIPVGSRGIMGEAKELAANVNCSLELYPNLPVDITKSGGPSTSLIFTCSSDNIPLNFSSIPLVKIGYLK